MLYVYTLTSSPNDNFYEQFLLSASSLILKTPDANIILLCDKKTEDSLTKKRCAYKKLISNIVALDAPGNLSQVETSRWVRTSIRRFIKGDFLFLDGDTIIADDLSPIKNLNLIFAACLDKHSLIKNHSKKENIVQNDKLLGFNSYTSNRHYNGGVLFCADTARTHKLFERWHELWLFSKSKNIIRDQPALNTAIIENQDIFNELEGIWNCQIAYNGLPYLCDSKIIHYFATDTLFNEPPLLFSKSGVWEKIKETGEIPEDVLEQLKNPRSAFSAESKIISGNDALFVINSNLFQFIYLLKIKAPSLFNFINRLCSIFKKAIKNYIIKKNSRSKASGSINLYN